MRCPNCSFQNTDDADVCKICGYELKPQKPSSSRYQLDDDAALDQSVDALFGATTDTSELKNRDKRFEEYANMPESEDEPISEDELKWLETLKRDMEEVDDEFNALKRKQEPKVEPQSDSNSSESEILANDVSSVDTTNETPDAPPEEETSINETIPPEDAEEAISLQDDDYNLINLKILSKNSDSMTEPDETSEDFYDDSEYDDIAERHRVMRNRSIVIIGALIVLVLIMLKVFGGGSAKVGSEDDPAISETENAVDIEDLSKAYTDAIVEQTGIFFGQLKSYVNDGNIAVLSRFENSQNALEQLSTFKSSGTLDDFKLSMPNEISADPTGTEVSVGVNLTRTSNDQTASSETVWQFSWVLIDDQWLISNLEIASQESAEMTTDNNTATGNTSSNNSPSTNTGSNTGSNTSGSSSTSTTSQDIKPEGFISTGSFTGGIITDGQNVSSIRFGRHEAFDRVVFDLSNWTDTSTLIEEACHYEAKISDDGKTITLLLSGARGASATVPDLSASQYISGISVYYPEDDSSVGFTINLNQDSAFKTFDLKSPGKIVVDVMPD